MAEISVVTAHGFSATAATLQGLFNSRGETIDYIKDAHTTPGTFSPQCDFSGELVLRVGGCQVGLGWYNATAGTTTPPAESEIYELLPAVIPRCPTTIDPATTCCDDSDFCPLATYETTQTGQHRWNMVPFSSATLRGDARYTGGQIGFVLRGKASTQCNQNKYSQLDLNQKSPSGEAWVGTLVYQSTVEPNSYYLAFDDLPTTQTSWMGAPTGLSNDGDFNDYVVFIKRACADQGAGGAAGGDAPGNGGSAGVVGGNNGGAGSAGAPGGTTEGGRGGTDSTGGAGGGAIVNGAGGALASGGATGNGGTSGGGGASASASGGTTGSAGVSGGVPAASGANSGCSCATVPDQGAERPLTAGLLLALALCHRRRRQT